MSIVAEEILPPEREGKADKPGFLYDVGAGVIDRRDGGGGGGKIYTFNDDYSGIKDAGKDIDGIMANGGFTIEDTEDDYAYYESNLFLYNERRSVDNKMIYYFKSPRRPEPDKYYIDGNDLCVIWSPT